jgi:non-specific serine/threonine protein kinase
MPTAADSTAALPQPLTSFVGREREVAAVTALLREARLVTLTGIGGVGKTRLALHVADGLLATATDAPDGGRLAELAPLADPALVPQTVAAAVGLHPEPGQPVLALLVAALRARQLLLVLDNCEHVIDTAAQLADAVLRGCPGVRILATSREPLRIDGETAWRVPSLATADPDRLPPLDRLAQTEAVRLFVERAQAAQPGFALTAQNAAAVAQVGWQLDGIPLAIELAAARVPGLGVAQLAQRLDERFRLLTGGSRTAPPRQQTLRTAVDWSYALLSAPERTLFGRLSVFAGGFTLAAAEAVCGDPEHDVLQLLPRLVDKSLVLAEEQPDGSTRYRLLETLRQYAGERLAAAGEVEPLARHAEYFRSLAAAASLRWDTANTERGVHSRGWLAQADVEHDNFRQALRWYQRQARRGDAEAVQRGLQLAVALGLFWNVRGYLQECAGWLRAFLAYPAADAPTGARARALTWLALTVQWTESEAEAMSLYQESRDVARQTGDRWAEAMALYNLGAHGQEHDVVAARRRLQEALAIMRELDTKALIGSVLHDLGNVAFRLGDLDQAMTFQEQAAALHRETGEERGLSMTLEHLSRTVEALGDSVRARQLCEEALRVRRSLGDRPRVATMLVRLAGLHRARGDLARARPLLEESMAIRRATGVRRGTVVALRQLAEVARAQGDVATARTALEEALALARDMDDVAGAQAVDAELASLPPSMPLGPLEALRTTGRASVGAEGRHGAARPAAAGGPLTAREREVAALVAEGLTNKQIGERLVISERTVDNHVQRILARLGATNRAQVAAWVGRENAVPK